jgi:amidase
MNPFATATELLEAFRRGETAAVELVRVYQERRVRFADRVNAIVTPDDERSLQAAQRCDSLRGTPAAGVLNGLPLTIKDGIHVAGLPTTGGMIEPAKAVARDDAPNVERLREAGAIVLGKTNVPVANADWQAVNAFFGRTSNPWNPELTCGGSTGGGAAALASGLSAAELGSDIGGSIRIPAAFCGVFGHKPSATALPGSGHFPWRNFPNPARGLAVQGPLARSAADLELLFDVLAGADGLERKAWRLELPRARFERLADCRVGVLKVPEWIPVEASILGAQQALTDTLAKCGAQVRSVDLAPHFGDLTGYYKDFLTQLQCILGGALPAVTRAKAAAKMRGYQDPFLDAIADGLEGGAGLLITLLETSERYKAQWERVFQDVDALLSPVCSTNAFAHDDSYFYDRELPIDGVPTPYYRLSSLPSIASMAGLPATVFPSGRQAATGAPIGLQVTGAYLEDRSTLRFARLVEAEIGGFVAPPGFS